MKKKIILSVLVILLLSSCSNKEAAQTLPDESPSVSISQETPSASPTPEPSESVQPTPKPKTEEELYIEQYIDLLSYNVRNCEGYTYQGPGLDNLSFKNTGDRDIESLTVTVYFQDENGKNIAEKSILVLGRLDGGLKANYSWKMESDRFYPLENLADEVDISRYTVAVSSITFAS